MVRLIPAVLLPAALSLLARHLLNAPLSWTALGLLLAVLIVLKTAAALAAPPPVPGGRPVPRGAVPRPSALRPPVLRFPPRVAAALRLLSAALSAVLAAAVLIGILITPYAAYRVWFEAAGQGLPRGTVSSLLLLVAVLYSTSFGPLFLTSGFLLPAGLHLLAAAGLLALVRQGPLEYSVLLFLLAAVGCGPALRAMARADRLRGGLAVGLALLLVGWAALTAAGLAFRPAGSRVVNQHLHPGLRRAVSTLWPGFPLLYGIPGFGYGFPPERLGGRPLLSEAPIFEIEWTSPAALYLRTAVYDRYDGASWSRQAPAAAAGLPPSAPPAAPAASSSAAPSAAGGFLQPLAAGVRPPPAAIRLTVAAEYYGLLPHTLDTLRIHLPAAAAAGAEGDADRGFELREPLRRGESIFLERGRGSGVAAPPLGEAERENGLQLPGGLSADLRALAAGLADPGGDPFSTLRRIESFLASGYAYNLQVGRGPAGRDFVEEFLFAGREGYCVHFASAFALLARLNGIPARYATGFLVRGIPPGAGGAGAGSAVAVRGLSAHAWPEVWLEGPGWTAWEATPAANPDHYTELEQGWLYELELRSNRLTDRQLQAILGREVLAVEAPPGRSWWSAAVRFAAVLLPAALLLAAVAVLLRRAWHSYGFALFASARPDRRRALRLVAGIERGLRREGLPPPGTTGWVAWGRELARKRPDAGKPVARLTGLVLRLVYTGRPVGRRDLSYLRAFYLRYCAGRKRGRLSQGRRPR